ncbi:NO-inducible flavohemoprotein [Halalkalibacter hemicellulosilyticus]|uniref:Flavohemoprotein n=1 Tax=Halalkalibacter hemicellulosilyticusJCM 9152 TaxID=1236971 RepID=W4QGW9_9BACI|nr:NO-inducible flavohemoprotein [Halalkalibacter hemicellulosilyticus]GAE30579.1 flavohemoprotein [Halalkalibacter hemicellulosilyticusJCM 9152]
MLSTKTIKIIKSTAPILANKGVDITSHFYESMFNDHPELLHIFNHANQKKGRQQTALANTVYAAAQNIDQLEVLLPKVKQIAHKHRSLQVKAEHYPIVGEYLLKAIKEVLGEAATEDIFNAWEEAYGVIAQVFIDVENEMYEEAAQQIGGWDGYKTFKVIRKQVESECITSFYLHPVDQDVIPNFKPGQYVTVRVQIPGEKYLSNRQYSLSDIPGKPYLRISVKRESEHQPEGKVSNYLHDQIDINHELELTAPAGEFTLNETNEKPIYFLSGGVGITPLLSMAKYVAWHNPNRKLTFIHAAKDGKTRAFQEEIKQLMTLLKNGKSITFFSEPKKDDHLHEDYDYKGFIKKEHITEMITDQGIFYICGPVPFMKQMISYLNDPGLQDSEVRYEFFGPAMAIAPVTS